MRWTRASTEKTRCRMGSRAIRIWELARGICGAQALSTDRTEHTRPLGALTADGPVQIGRKKTPRYRAETRICGRRVGTTTTRTRTSRSN